MRKSIIWLLVLLTLGILLTACNPLNSPGNNTQVVWRSASPTPEQSATPETVPSVTPETTDLQILEFTSTPNPPDPTITPTASVEPTLVETEELVAGSTRISEIDHMEQVYVPAGEFIMGSEDNEAIQTTETGRAYPEIPLHTVYLDSYWMDKYEVTNSQYALCVAAGACRPPFFNTSFTVKEYYTNPDYANYPVIYVDWGMARRYCEWSGRRLPTEAEWEKAARGTEGLKYPWGNDPIDGSRANWCDSNCPRDFANQAYDDGYADTAPVGSYPAGASPYGVMDMAGNVWEWTGTLIQPYPYDPSDGREVLDANGERAWRGAAFSNGYWWMRASVRYRSVTYYRYYNLGFRCASTP